MFKYTTMSNWERHNRLVLPLTIAWWSGTIIVGLAIKWIIPGIWFLLQGHILFIPHLHVNPRRHSMASGTSPGLLIPASAFFFAHRFVFFVLLSFGISQCIQPTCYVKVAHILLVPQPIVNYLMTCIEKDSIIDITSILCDTSPYSYLDAPLLNDTPPLPPPQMGLFWT